MSTHLPTVEINARDLRAGHVLDRGNGHAQILRTVLRVRYGVPAAPSLGGAAHVLATEVLYCDGESRETSQVSFVHGTRCRIVRNGQ